MMPRGDGDGHARAGESITAGNCSNDLSRSFSMSSSDDTNSNILFSVPRSKKAKVLRAGRQEGQGAHRRRRWHGYQLQQNRIPIWPVEHVSGQALHGRLPAAAAGLCHLRSPRQAWLRHSTAKHR